MASPIPHALEACTDRANDLMALSRERIADELLKLLALDDPTPTVRLMHQRGLFAPVVPEVTGVDRLAALVARRASRPASRPTRSAVWPLCCRADPGSRRARRGAAQAVEQGEEASGQRRRTRRLAAIPQRSPIGWATEGAVDRLLLAARPADAASDRGLDPAATADRRRRTDRPRRSPKGPEVARTLKRIEDAWEAAGFPKGEEFKRMVDEALG